MHTQHHASACNSPRRSACATVHASACNRPCGSAYVTLLALPIQQCTCHATKASRQEHVRPAKAHMAHAHEAVASLAHETVTNHFKASASTSTRTICQFAAAGVSGTMRQKAAARAAHSPGCCVAESRKGTSGCHCKCRQSRGEASGQKGAVPAMPSSYTMPSLQPCL